MHPCYDVLVANSGVPDPPELDGDEQQPGNPRNSVVVPKGRGVHSASTETAATLLLRALRATGPEARTALALAGLSRLEREEPDEEMEALLLRQLYLGQLEEGDFAAAMETAEDMIELAALGDVARQDAARAALGLGEVDVAVGHLRIAARIAPDSRRAFHLATLGALLRFSGRSEEAISAFEHAVRVATEDRALYQAQLALSEVAAGRPSSQDLATLRTRLESSEHQRGYTLWVLGELCSHVGDEPASRDYFTRFLDRMTHAGRAKALALRGEVALAQGALRKSS